MEVAEEYDRERFQEEVLKGYRRYEKLRKFNVQQFAELYKRNIKEDYRFDDLIDAWPDYPTRKK